MDLKLTKLRFSTHFPITYRNKIKNRISQKSSQIWSRFQKWNKKNFAQNFVARFSTSGLPKIHILGFPTKNNHQKKFSFILKNLTYSTSPNTKSQFLSKDAITQQTG